MPWKTKAELAAEKLQKAEQEISREKEQLNPSATKTLEPDQKIEKKKLNEFADDYNLEVMADYDPGADLFRIPKKDPNYSYRYLRDEAKNLSLKTNTLLFQQGGWQLCPRHHCLRIGIREVEISPDGFHRRGEHVLAFMPQELFLKKEAAKGKKAALRMDQVNRTLKEGDPTVGGREMHKTMKGIQPAYKLGMGPKED